MWAASLFSNNALRGPWQSVRMTLYRGAVSRVARVRLTRDARCDLPPENSLRCHYCYRACSPLRYLPKGSTKTKRVTRFEALFACDRCRRWRCGERTAAEDGDQKEGRQPSTAWARIEIPYRCAQQPHFVYPRESGADEQKQVVKDMEGTPVFVVAHAAKFAERGGIANCIVPDSGVRLAINKRAAKNAGLKVSAKPLRLAEFRVCD